MRNNDPPELTVEYERGGYVVQSKTFRASKRVGFKWRPQFTVEYLGTDQHWRRSASDTPIFSSRKEAQAIANRLEAAANEHLRAKGK